MPINADIAFGGKRILYYSGYRIALDKWDVKAQRVKHNSFLDGVSAADINQRLVKIASAVDDAFDQLELREEEVAPTTVRDELKRILDEEKSTRLTMGLTYQVLINERKMG